MNDDHSRESGTFEQKNVRWFNRSANFDKPNVGTVINPGRDLLNIRESNGVQLARMVAVQSYEFRQSDKGKFPGLPV